MSSLIEFILLLTEDSSAVAASAAASADAMSKRRIDVDGTLGPNAAKVAKPVLTPGMKMNPYTALPFTPRYFELFRKRIQVRTSMPSLVATNDTFVTNPITRVGEKSNSVSFLPWPQ